ncbi:MAG: S8 family serine peptidase, partial [Paludibacteraceae bacterium]|nr:S8 family serine peptidase [Paludibacteraceae bacterium]
MRKPLFIYYGLIVALFNIQLICSQNVGIGTSTDNSSSPTKGEAHKKNYVEGEVLVRFKPNTKVPTSVNNSLRATDESDQVQQVFRQLRVTNIKPIYTNSPKAKTRNVSVVKPNTFKLSFDTSSISTSKAIEYLNKMDEVLIAEPNYIKKALGTPVSKISDPLFSQQWAIFATRVNELWEVPTITDKRPVIAILDTGLDIDHEEFSGKIWTNDAEINGLPGIDDDGNGYVDDSIGYSMIWDNSKIYDIGAHGT